VTPFTKRWRAWGCGSDDAVGVTNIVQDAIYVGPLDAVDLNGSLGKQPGFIKRGTYPTTRYTPRAATLTT
jgi:hypothetical protein